MHRGGILEPFRRGDRRRMVVEIGAGWGGFAYQFKTLFPNTTYVIVDFPELFLFSATYLMTVFPGAAVRFWTRGRRDVRPMAGRGLHLRPEPARGRPAARAARSARQPGVVPGDDGNAGGDYAGLAAAAGCPALYSLNRERSPHNTEIDSVSAILSRHYDLRDVPLLGSGYLKATKKDSAVSVEEARRAGRFDEAGYRHLAGTLKQRTHARIRPGGACGAGAARRHRHDAAQPGDVSARGAIDSLLAQSYGHFELVMVDDGSTDGTEAIARAYEQRDPRVRYVRFPERRGMVAAWRGAFEQATARRRPLFCVGQRPRPMASALARDAGRHARSSIPTSCSRIRSRSASIRTARRSPSRRASSRPSASRDRDARWRLFNRSDAVAAGDMVYGLMRGVRGARGRRLSRGAVPRPPAARGTDAARRDPPGAGGAVVPAAVRHRQRRAPALDVVPAGHARRPRPSRLRGTCTRESLWATYGRAVESGTAAVVRDGDAA